MRVMAGLCRAERQQHWHRGNRRAPVEQESDSAALAGFSRRREARGESGASPGAGREPGHVNSDTSDIVVSSVSWSPTRAIDRQHWAEYGRRLGRLGTGANWWIGDWVRYGATHHGERSKLAAKITGYDVQTLMNLAYVASRFHPSDRRPDVSWSHHAELAPLERAQQQSWLSRVIADRLSQKDLRRELRAAGCRTAADENHQLTASVDVRPRCPACGRPLHQENARRI